MSDRAGDTMCDGPCGGMIHVVTGYVPEYDSKGGRVMKCMKCGCDAYMSTTSEAVELEYGLLVIRNIPCWNCEECGEVFYTGDVVRKIEEITERTKSLPQEVSIVDYSRVAKSADTISRMTDLPLFSSPIG
jgi:YgiT-type zinc finger domain-containing protein